MPFVDDQTKAGKHYAWGSQQRSTEWVGYTRSEVFIDSNPNKIDAKD